MSENADCLLLIFADRRYVVVASEVKNISTSPDAIAADIVSDYLSIDALLDEISTHQNNNREYWLQVVTHNQPTWLYTHAAIEIISLDIAGFYQLPALLRSSGCSPWIKGIVILETDHSHDDLANMALWIELSATPVSTKKQLGA